MKKVVFLDIDGVLNSQRYDRERTENSGNIDESRLPLLSDLIKKTGAEIVLSSTWKKHLGTEIGDNLCALFKKYNLEIFDKTPSINDFKRVLEVSTYIKNHESEIEAFVILDDLSFGWGDLEKYHVRTDYRIGRGLEERHVEKAIEILREAKK